MHPLNEGLPPLENCCQKLHVAVHPESGKSEDTSFLLENITKIRKVFATPQNLKGRNNY